jgi:hypothetical protein
MFILRIMAPRWGIQLALNSLCSSIRGTTVIVLTVIEFELMVTTHVLQRITVMLKNALTNQAPYDGPWGGNRHSY